MDWCMDQQIAIRKSNRDAVGYLCYGTVYFKVKKHFQLKMQEGEVNIIYQFLPICHKNMRSLNLPIITETNLLSFPIFKLKIIIML